MISGIKLVGLWILFFGKPCVTPTKDEYAMFLAFAAATRSGDLSRQVGAVITSETGEIIATGANDVPCFGGGLYWADHGEEDARDYHKGFDANEHRRTEILINSTFGFQFLKSKKRIIICYDRINSCKTQSFEL